MHLPLILVGGAAWSTTPSASVAGTFPSSTGTTEGSPTPSPPPTQRVDSRGGTAAVTRPVGAPSLDPSARAPAAVVSRVLQLLLEEVRRPLALDIAPCPTLKEEGEGEVMLQWMQPPSHPLLPTPTPTPTPTHLLGGALRTTRAAEAAPTVRAALVRRGEVAAGVLATLSLGVTWVPTSLAAYPLGKMPRQGASLLPLATWG